MGRRANNEGTEPKWNPTRKEYEGKITLAKGIRKTIRGKTKSQYYQNVKLANDDYSKGKPVTSSKQTTGEYISQWVELYGAPSWKPGTTTDHAQSLRLHVLPHIGPVMLKDLRRDHLQQMVNKWAEAGQAPSSIRKYLQPVRGAVAAALDDGLITKNPFTGLRLPKLKKEEITFFTRQEAAAYASALPPTSNGRLLSFILRSGLRRGEAMGLQWQDIGEHSFKVQRTVRHHGAELYINSDGKTENSLREIPLNDQLRGILEEQRKHQMQQRLKAGSGWIGGAPCSDDMWIFANDIGKCPDESNVRRTHNAALKAAGLSGVDIHGLRHTFATLWVEKGANIKNLSAVLGHADTAITLNRYVHPVREQMQEEMRVMGGLF